MGNVPGKELFPTVVYDHARDVNEQLQYFEPLMNTCKPFVFVNLGLRVSVQAGYGQASEFVMPDARVLTYPFLHCMSSEESQNMFDRTKGVEHRARVEKEMFPLACATHYEIAVMGEIGDNWFTPNQLQLRVSREVKECWTNGQTGRFVPKDGVETILKKLQSAEKYMTQRKAERQAFVYTQKQQLARIADLPSHIKSLIGKYLQASFEKNEKALVESNVDKMSKGYGLAFALDITDHVSCLQLDDKN